MLCQFFSDNLKIKAKNWAHRVGYCEKAGFAVYMFVNMRAGMFLTLTLFCFKESLCSKQLSFSYPTDWPNQSSFHVFHNGVKSQITKDILLFDRRRQRCQSTTYSRQWNRQRFLSAVYRPAKNEAVKYLFYYNILSIYLTDCFLSYYRCVSSTDWLCPYSDHADVQSMLKLLAQYRLLTLLMVTLFESAN